MVPLCHRYTRIARQRLGRLTLLGVALLCLTLGVGPGSGASKFGLMEEDVGAYSVLRSGLALTDTTIQAAITALAGANRTMLITPGTWTIANDLTIPENIRLSVAEGATLSINTARTLTINGEFVAPREHVITGAGAVVFGKKVPAVDILWLGAICDGATNDQAALAKAFITAKASVAKGVKLPGGVCRVTAETDFRGVSIRGDEMLGSKIFVDGNGIRGLYYQGAGEDLDIILEHFTVEGSNGASGGTNSLIEIKTAKGVKVRNVRTFKTAVYGLYFDFVVNYSIIDSSFHGCLRACIALKNNSNAGLVTGNWFEADLGIPEWLDGAIYLAGSTSIAFIGNAIEGEGAGRGQYAVVLEGSGFLTFQNNFIEAVVLNVFLARTIASGDVTLTNNHLHCICNFPLVFATDDLEHTNLKITDNHFVGVNASSNLFAPGNTLMWEFRHNTRDQEAGACVQGFGRCHIIWPVEDALTAFRDGIGILRGVQNLDKTMSASADGTELQLNHADAAGKVVLRPAGQPRLQASNTGVSILRLSGTLGTALISSDFVLHGNWGSGATISNIVGTDTAFSFTVNSGGSGVGGSPTVVLTWRDGSFGSAPVVILTRTGGNNLDVKDTWATTATSLTITHNGNPDASGTFGYAGHVIGR